MFIWSGEVYTHIQHWPRVFNLELGQLFCYLAIKQFTKFFFSHPYHLSSQTCQDQGPCVLLVLWEEDLVKALEKRSPRKFYLRNHPLLPVDFLDGKNKTPKRKWTHHSASDGEKSFVTRQQILQLLESEEPWRHFVPIPPPGIRLSKNCTHTFQKTAFYRFSPLSNLNFSLCQVSPIFSSLSTMMKIKQLELVLVF